MKREPTERVYCEDTLSADFLSLKERENVVSTYVQAFNKDIRERFRKLVSSICKMMLAYASIEIKLFTLQEKENNIRMEIFMRRFALVDSKDYSTNEDHHLYDKVPMPPYSSFSSKTSRSVMLLVH